MARRQAGPSRTAVSPSTATISEALAAYLESPLLYSFPTKVKICVCQQNYNPISSPKVRQSFQMGHCGLFPTYKKIKNYLTQYYYGVIG